MCEPTGYGVTVWQCHAIPRSRSRVVALPLVWMLTVLADPDRVRIVDGTEVLACHRRSYDKGAQIEDPAHLQALVEDKRAARRHRGADRLATAAPAAQRRRYSWSRRP